MMMEINNLSENHKRTISSALKVIERLIHEIESGLTTPEQGTMFVLVNDVDDTRKSHSLQLIDEMKSYISLLHTKYNLSTEKLALNWMIEINKTKIWEVLSNTTSKRLKNYGAFPAEFISEFDNDIARFQKLVENL